MISKKNKRKKNQVLLPTIMHNIDSLNISASDVVSIDPGEGQLPVLFTSAPDSKVLAFVKSFSAIENDFSTERKAQITSKYLHSRLKRCEYRFASDLLYLFQALNWIGRNAVESTIRFIKRKYFQTDITVGCLQNQDNMMRMITDDQIFCIC